MQFLRNWIRNIILIILLAHFIEMLLPDNELKKYVKVVIGFFIILVILSPIFELTQRGFAGISLNLTSSERPSFEEIVQKGNNLRRRQNEDVQEEYKVKLSQQIEAIVKLNSKVREVEAEVSLNKDNHLNGVVVKAEKEEDDTEKDTSEGYETEKKMAGRLQDIISTLYGLEADQVRVQLH